MGSILGLKQSGYNLQPMQLHQSGLSIQGDFSMQVRVTPSLNQEHRKANQDLIHEQRDIVYQNQHQFMQQTSPNFFKYRKLKASPPKTSALVSLTRARNRSPGGRQGQILDRTEGSPFPLGALMREHHPNEDVSNVLIISKFNS